MDAGAAGRRARGGAQGARGVTLRSMLYALARLLGDVNAVQKGKVPQRVERRVTGKFMGRILGKLFR